MAHTERFGLNQFGGSDGGDLADDGYKFSVRDRETIDRLLAAFEGHRHTGGQAEVWEPTTSYGFGTKILPTVRNGHVYLAIVAGISASTEPTWPTGAAATVTDGGVTWQEGGSEQTSQLPDPAGLPTLELDDDTDASLPAGTSFFYRVGFVDAYGLETAASDEASVTTPDPLETPEPPSAVAAAGGDLEDGPYYYAVSYTQTDGNLQTELSDTTFVVCEVGDNTVELELPTLPADADGWKLYRLGPNEADLVLLDTQLAAAGTSYTDDGTTAVAEPLQYPPEENTTNSRNKVTITAPDVDVDDELPAGVRRWRIYRSEESGDYPEQSLVHEVVETTTQGGTILIHQWEDLGDELVDGIPLDTSITLNPPGPAAVLLGTADPLADGTADPGSSGAAARQDHVHPTGGHTHTAATVTSTATGTVAATNVQAAIAELESEKLGLGTATPLIEGTGAVGTSPLGARQDHVHPAGVGSATPLIEGTGAAGSSALSSRQDHVHPAANLELLTDVDLTSPADGQVLTYDSGTSQWVNETPSGGGGASDLEGLSDVDLTSPSDGQVLTYDSGTSQWVNETPSGGGGGGDLEGLSDVDLTSPADGHLLEYNGSQWVNVAAGFVTAAGGGQETVHAHGAMGASEILDPDDGNLHTGTLDDDCSLLFDDPPSGVACRLTVILSQNGTGNWDANWPASVLWPAGTAPTMTAAANATDIYSFVTVDGGTSWYGRVVGQDYS